MTNRLLVFSFLLQLFPSIALSLSPKYTETILTLSNGMIATHTAIDGVDSLHNQSVALLVHGWTGQMDEVGDMYKRLAAKLAENGIPSLRINIRGESEREATNYRLTSTFKSRVTDAQTGLDYLLSRYPKANIGVVGFSLGGSTTMQLLGANPQQIASAVFWSTAGDPSKLFVNLTEQQRQTVLEKGEITLPYWVDITITKQHMLGFDGFDVFTNLKNYQGALLSIRGTEDSLEPQEEQLLKAASSNPEEVYLIEGADHTFNTLDDNSNYDELVIDKTNQWLVNTLD